MAAQADSGTTNSKEFGSLSSPFTLDLVAFFSELEGEIIKITEQASNEGWTEDELIEAIGDLI